MHFEEAPATLGPGIPRRHMGRYAAAEAGGSLHPAVLLLTTSVVAVGCLGHGGQAGGTASAATAAPHP